MSNKHLVVILGATATGKTDVAIELASRFHSEIISSDSRQFYRETPIGTAMPTPEQLKQVPHHMIATHSVRDEYSCGVYANDVLALVEERFQHHDVLFLAGGSGLYIDAITRGFDPMPEVAPALRIELLERLEQEGLEALTAQLQELDPTYYAQVDRKNPQRVVRALEVCLQSGQPYSTIRKGTPQERPFNILKLGIEMPREVLYERINLRVDMMVEQGLEAEAKAMLPFKECNALRTVGYQEWFPYFEGEYSREKAIELIKRNSRRYAKRQQTWFRRDEHIHWIGSGNEAIEQGTALIKQAQSHQHP